MNAITKSKIFLNKFYDRKGSKLAMLYKILLELATLANIV